MNSIAKWIAISACLAGIATAFPAKLPVQTGQAGPTVTLNAPGWSLEKICEAISQQIGQKVVAQGDCVTDHLIVKVRNVPWSVLQQKLAWAEYGHWENINNVLTIERDPKLVQSRIQQNIDQLATNIERDFKLDKKNKTPFDALQLLKRFRLEEKRVLADNAQDRRHQSRPAVLEEAFGLIPGNQPFSVQLKRIAESISPQTLAAIPFNTRVVYSNHPTSLQLALPPSAIQVIDNTIVQNNNMVKLFHSHGIDISRNPPPETLSLISPNFTFLLAFGNMTGNGIYITLRAFDLSGVLKGCYYDLIGADYPGLDDLVPHPVFDITLSPRVVQDFAQLLASPTESHSEELLQQLRHPLQTDPFALLIAPMLDAVAPDKNCVVNADSLLSLVGENYFLFKQGTVRSDFFTIFPDTQDSDVDSSPDWLNIRPVPLSYLPTQAIPRSSYESLVQSVNKNGLFDFDQSMKYATSVGPAGYLSVADVSCFLRILGRGRDPLNKSGISWNVFRLVGSLDAGQLGHAKTKRGLRLDSLSPRSSEILKSVLFYGYMGPSGNAYNFQQSKRVPATLKVEPTAAFADSLHGGVLKISLHKWTQISYLATGLGASHPTRNTKDPIGFRSFIKWTKNDVGTQYDFTRLRLVQHYNYSITISFPEAGYPTIRAYFNTDDTNPRTYNGINNLPPEIRKEAKMPPARVSAMNDSARG